MLNADILFHSMNRQSALSNTFSIHDAEFHSTASKRPSLKSKTVPLLIILFFATNFSLHAEGLDNFMGIPFGATMDEARTAMESQGWLYDVRNSYTTLLVFTSAGGTFRGLSVRAINLDFVDGKFVRAYVAVIQRINDLTDAITEMNKIVKENGMVKEFNFDWTSSVSRTYRDKDGNQLCGIFYRKEGYKNVLLIFSDCKHGFYRK
jgi:hypothetical protein